MVCNINLSEKKWGKIIQTAGYNGARTVFINLKKKVLMFCIMSLVFNRRELNSSLLLPSYADAHTHTAQQKVDQHQNGKMN